MTASFAEAHVHRLEAIRRITGNVEREADGTWIIAPDHLERAAAYERRQAKNAPVVIRTPSALLLNRQFGADGVRDPARSRAGLGRTRAAARSRLQDGGA